MDSSPPAAGDNPPQALAGDRLLCPICRRRPVGRNQSGRCEVCNAVARATLRGAYGGRDVLPAPVAPLVLRPIPPLAEINRKLNQWLTAQMEANQ